jgi:protein-tyrosine phosphatase
VAAARVAAFVDLRSDEEAARRPPHALIDAGVRWLHCPIGRGDDAALRVPRPAPDAYAAYYAGLIEQFADRFVEAVGQVAAQDGRPLVFGCHAGKDRTGILAAILLDLAGASEEAIAADYAASAPYLLARIDHFRPHWERRGLDRSDYQARMATVPESILGCRAILQRRWGGLLPFLAQRGLAGGLRARIASLAPAADASDVTDRIQEVPSCAC